MNKTQKRKETTETVIKFLNNTFGNCVLGRENQYFELVIQSNGYEHYGTLETQRYTVKLKDAIPLFNPEDFPVDVVNIHNNALEVQTLANIGIKAKLRELGL